MYHSTLPCQPSAGRRKKLSPPPKRRSPGAQRHVGPAPPRSRSWQRLGAITTPIPSWNKSSRLTASNGIKTLFQRLCKEQTLLLQLLLFIPSLPGGQDLREAPQNRGGERPELRVAPHPFGPASYSAFKKGNPVICYNLDESRDHSAK